MNTDETMLSGITAVILLARTLDCEALEALLTSHCSLDVIGTTTTPDDLTPLCQRLRPDVAIVDSSIPLSRGDVFSAVTMLLESEIVKYVLFLDTAPNLTRARRATTIGRSGYVTRNRTTEQFASALHELVTGGMPLDAVPSDWLRTGHAANRRRTVSPALAQLSPREIEVLCLVAEGYSESECGDLLGLSQRTVSNHKMRLMKKLDVRKVVHLTLLAVREGLIVP